MKSIGICAITPPGAAICYQTILQHANNQYPEKDNPDIFMIQTSVNKFIDAWNNNDYQLMANLMLDSIDKLSQYQPDFIIIPSNTMHRVIKKVQQLSPIPVLNMLDIAAKNITNNKYKKILMLGTSLTMSGELYHDPFNDHDLIQVLPNDQEQKIINDIILKNLIPMNITDNCINALKVIAYDHNYHCDAVMLACTELPLVLNESNITKPIIDTTRVLAKAACELAFHSDNQ